VFVGSGPGLFSDGPFMEKQQDRVSFQTVPSWRSSKTMNLSLTRRRSISSAADHRLRRKWDEIRTLMAYPYSHPNSHHRFSYFPLIESRLRSPFNSAKGSFNHFDVRGLALARAAWLTPRPSATVRLTTIGRQVYS
jgi:hypothetical protein